MPPTPRFLAGALALDFINTSSGRGGEGEVERLRRPQHLLAWLALAGCPAPASLAASLEQGRTAERWLEDARSTRELLYALVRRYADARPVEPGVLAAFNRLLGPALAGRALVSAGVSLSWRQGEARRADDLLAPVLLSAADLLVQTDPQRIRECPGRHCGWMFLDTSRNGRRRWCDMATCGNRVKARRHQRRRTAAD